MAFDNDMESIEDLGRANLRLIQRKDGFRFGEDSVLLAWFVAQELSRRKRKPIHVLELGTNCGAVSVLLAGRRSDVDIVGIERQVVAASVFQRNIEMNALGNRMHGYCLDLRELPISEIPKASFDAVYMNPPFSMDTRGPKTTRGDDALAAARFEEYGTIDDFIRVGASMLFPDGDMFIVIRAARMADVISSLQKASMAVMRIQNVHPYVHKDASLCLIRARKSKKSGGFRMLPPLIIRKKDGTYTETLLNIYRSEDESCSI